MKHWFFKLMILTGILSVPVFGDVILSLSPANDFGSSTLTGVNNAVKGIGFKIENTTPYWIYFSSYTSQSAANWTDRFFGLILALEPNQTIVSVWEPSGGGFGTYSFPATGLGIQSPIIADLTYDACDDEECQSIALSNQSVLDANQLTPRVGIEILASSGPLPEPIPEPSTFLLLTSAAAWMVVALKRR